MILEAWDVLWPYDPEARPPKPKLWVCVEPDELCFLRINSKPSKGSVALAKARHPFLERDSWLHCWGELIETDSAQLQDLLERQRHPTRKGLLGVIAAEVRKEVGAAIRSSPVLAPKIRARIEAALRCAGPTPPA